MFERIRKYWHQSRTIWAALIHGLPALVLSILQAMGAVDLSPILGAKAAAVASVYMMIAVIVLRAITTKPLGRGRE